MKIDNEAMTLELSKGRALSEFFVQYLLARNIRNHEELVDRFFGSGEMRVARRVCSNWPISVKTASRRLESPKSVRRPLPIWQAQPDCTSGFS